MKNILKTLSLILALNIIFVSNIFGATNFIVSSPSGNMGKEVSVDVSIKDNTGFVGYQMLLNYDTSKLEYVSSKNGDLVNSKFAVLSEDKDKGTVKQACVSNSVISENGQLMTVTFKVKEGITNENIPINLNVQKLINDVGDADVKNIEYTVSNGNIILEDKKNNVTSISTKELINIIKNENGKISLKLKEGTTDKKVIYRSTDETKAIIDEEGNVIPIANGDVKIEALVDNEVIDTITLNIPIEEKTNDKIETKQEKITENTKTLNKKYIIIVAIVIVIVILLIVFSIKCIKNKNKEK